jgi:hypothetical protein
MTLPTLFKARGVLTVWSGNEAALTLANPAIEVDGRIVATRGENWTSPRDVSRTDVGDSAGFVPIDPTDVAEGDVAWLAGPLYVDNYLTLLKSGVRDRLGILDWRSLPGGWRIRFDSSSLFYETGAIVANDARRTYGLALASGEAPESETVVAARSVYTGSPGVTRGDRRLADAVWYSMTGDVDLFSRAVHLASTAFDRPEGEIEVLVEKQIGFYQAFIRRARLESTDELERLRAAVTHLYQLLRAARRKDRAKINALNDLNAALVPARSGETMRRQVHEGVVVAAECKVHGELPKSARLYGLSNTFGSKIVNSPKSDVTKTRLRHETELLFGGVKDDTRSR